jgi:hypothetical protein
VPPAVRALLHVAALVAGAAVGVLGSFVHPLVRFGVPYGLLLGLVLTGVTVATAGLLTRARSGALAAAAGWLVAVATLSLQRSEGDLIVPATGLGYAWLLGGTAVVGLALAVPYGLLAGEPRPAVPDRFASTGAARIGR